MAIPGVSAFDRLVNLVSFHWHTFRSPRLQNDLLGGSAPTAISTKRRACFVFRAIAAAIRRSTRTFFLVVWLEVDRQIHQLSVVLLRPSQRIDATQVDPHIVRDHFKRQRGVFRPEQLLDRFSYRLHGC